MTKAIASFIIDCSTGLESAWPAPSYSTTYRADGHEGRGSGPPSQLCPAQPGGAAVETAPEASVTWNAEKPPTAAARAHDCVLGTRRSAVPWPMKSGTVAPAIAAESAAGDRAAYASGAASGAPPAAASTVAKSES